MIVSDSNGNGFRTKGKIIELLVCKSIADFIVSGPAFVNCTRAWLEQRSMTYIAIEALQDHPVAADVKRELQQLHPDWPDLDSELRSSNLFICGWSLRYPSCCVFEKEALASCPLQCLALFACRFHTSS